MDRREFLKIAAFEVGMSLFTKDIFRFLNTVPSTPGEIIRRGDPSKAQVALTFDDGFLPQHVEKILRVAEYYNLRFTFFPLGWRVMDREPDLWRAVLDAGHEGANHSYTHRVLRTDRLSLEEIANDIKDHQTLLDQVAGRYVPVRFFRPPGGYIEPIVLQIANEQGYDVVTWSRSSGGTGAASTPDSSYENVIKATNGDIVLMHCINNDTARLSEMIEKLFGENLEIVTISKLLDLDPPASVDSQS
ncbi:hypothetical protein A3B45_05305 [Candidatus Daviesbacteria bacterium RIFCSPLOWO2_01_FULL_39_12]|uniref:NodB homology domain-containing protein n=1 Tax=Candidatus Daviesbacteria bacterium RIFCSPLOWO2_01_FULL_39_12 TaxID=1797785 RepID=A0A1F5KQ54_9BACT|nr:MAG: hypothetical protein A3D79_02610 [Candidatus Daviesbacteria bacterium RIFCSPHIGHO2_02_FULL_39_8]OGE43022.1 MAG: hypothetical protein A3B45_05305 [Candidatus Daviesbacteria bacterium RIFCSPLOWO2_01_FULL_39_12]